MNERKWMFTYFPNNDNSLSTMMLIAMPEFNEIGEYTEEECNKIKDWIHKQPKKDWMATNYKEWDKFVEDNKIKIKELLK